MKKFLAVLLAGTMILSLTACGGDSGESGGGAAEAADFTVGMITDVGGVNDQSFNQSAWEGLKALEAETGVKVSYMESEQEADYGPNIDIMIDAETDLIWCIGFMMADAAMNAATTNTDYNFAIVDNAYDDTPANLTGVVFRANEPSYLVGYMAGHTTKTDIVGFVGGIKGAVIDQFEFGYRAGVAYAANELGKEIEVKVQYANSFNDDAMGKAIATSMYTDGADIVFHAAGSVGQGVIEAARDMDKLAIGVDMDQSALAPDHVMTSALKLVGGAMKEVSKMAHAGESIGGKTLAFGIKEGACGIPEYAGSTEKLVDKAVYDKTIEIQDKIVSGDIVVPDNEADFETYINSL